MAHFSANERFGSGSTKESADASFVGRVSYVGPEPAYLSGIAPALQTLGMTVTDVRQGSLSVGDSTEVDVVVVAGNPHIGVGTAGIPALDASMVQPDALVLVWANLAGGRWRAVEISTDGPQPPANYAGGVRRRR
jgi:hypothetical protein